MGKSCRERSSVGRREELKGKMNRHRKRIYLKIIKLRQRDEDKTMWSICTICHK